MSTNPKSGKVDVHELSLCESIAEAALWHADGRTVRAVNLRVGQLRQAAPDTLAFYWNAVIEDSLLRSAELVVEQVPLTVACGDCGTSTVLAEPKLRCGNCDGTNVTVTSGEEFVIDSIDLVDTAGAGTDLVEADG